MTSSPETGNQPSRLRKSGLSRTVLAGALVACASPAIAHATVIYSGPVNQTVSGDNSITLTVDGVDVLEFDVADKGKNSGAPLVIVSDDSGVVGMLSGGGGTTYGTLDILAPGSSVGSGTVDLINGGNSFDVPLSSTPFDIGFDLTFSTNHGSKGGQLITLYGYADITTTADSVTILDYAYDNSGAAIQTPGGLSGKGSPTVTPEPSSLALLLTGIGGIGSVIRRRRAVR
jgi:hypothetical protein